jgi:hypothetical protein
MDLTSKDIDKSILHFEQQNMTLIFANSVHDAYRKALNAIELYGKDMTARSNETKNLSNVTFCIAPALSAELPFGFFDKRVYCNNRKLTNKVQNAEFAWYMTGTNNVNCITKYIPNWSKFSDNGMSVNSNYGHIWKYQVPGILKKLALDKHTRQAVIQIYDGSMSNNFITKDVQCTLSIVFNIETDKDGFDRLHAHTTMRSNDVIHGFGIDAFSFMSLQELICNELRLIYPDLMLGNYQHTSMSLHIYSNHYKFLSSGVSFNDTKWQTSGNKSMSHNTTYLNFFAEQDKYFFDGLDYGHFINYCNLNTVSVASIISAFRLVMQEMSIANTTDITSDNVMQLLSMVKTTMPIINLPIFNELESVECFEYVHGCVSMSNGTIMLDVLAAMISLSTDLETFEQQLNNVSNATPLLPITAYDIIKLT